jgi:hypothetical protein
MSRLLPLLAVAALLVSLFAARLRADEQSDAKVARPFNGKNLEGWTFKEPKARSKWLVAAAKMNDEKNEELVPMPADEKRAELVNATGGGVDIYTLAKYGDCTIDLEFMVPKGSNSGIYVMGEYEVQIFDSYGKKEIGASDLGSIYSAAVPKVNAAKKPGEWQHMVIEFEAPRFADGKKTADARFVKVTLNDQVIHENVTIKGPTPSGVTGQEAATGPLMFQGDHGPVAYRKIMVKTK